MCPYFLIKFSATFFPDNNIPPNIGPILGPPNMALQDMPQAYSPAHFVPPLNFQR